jgi:hypothetical protein
MIRHLKLFLALILITSLMGGTVSAQYEGIPAGVPITLNNIEVVKTLNDVTPIGVDQCELPVVGALPAGVFTSVNLSLLNTDFVWTVRVDPDGLFLTNFPVCLFPAGRYYLTVNGTSVTQIEIPERNS